MERFDYLTFVAHDTLSIAIEQFSKRYRIAGIVCMFSGGNDSTTLAHMFRGRVSHFGHSNTQVGIEPTRQYVRDTASKWNVPLLEKFPEKGYGYEDLVLGRARSKTPRAKYEFIWPGGFPGPARHPMVFQKLKERGMDQMRNELVRHSFQERVIFLAGRRAQESSRRTSRFQAGSITPIEERGSVVWVSPLLKWTKLDLNEYRRRNPDVPANEVSDLLHMSGECLCGCFAHPGELDEIEEWYPTMARYLRNLQRKVVRAGLDIPAKACVWGQSKGKVCASGICNN
jgi:3'-phosphoadenosine 5'-phosphosulfate sulfotransferase (PAPS reductase)/FAD synthetase